MTSNGYFTGATGKRYTYAEIADRIRKEAPHTLGQHIFVQLEAIGLLEEMRNGTTPCGLPYSFASDPEPVRKQLTSNGMVHTPGFFRALRNDYRIKGEPRRRAIKTLSNVYGLPPDEAKGLLSGAIRIEIDEAAGTITYHTSHVEAALAALPTGDRSGRFRVEHDPRTYPDRVHVAVDEKFDVAIIRTDEGVVVDVYPKGGSETIATTYAFDAEAPCEFLLPFAQDAE